MRSQGELIIDMYLWIKGIAHITEKPVYDSNGSLLMTADFYLPDNKCYIEYWGMTENSIYLNRKKYKLNEYERLKLKLISIYPDDLKDIECKMKEFFNY